MSVSTEHRHRLIALLSRGYTRERAGLALGVTERTVYTWLSDDPTIQAEADRLAEASDPDAWQVLREAMNSARKDDGIDWAARIQAARAALSIPMELPAAAAGGVVTLVIHRDDSYEITSGGETPEATTDPEQPESAAVPAFTGGPEFSER